MTCFVLHVTQSGDDALAALQQVGSLHIAMQASRVCCKTLDMQKTAVWQTSFVLWCIAYDNGVALHWQATFSVQV